MFQAFLVIAITYAMFRMDEVVPALRDIADAIDNHAASIDWINDIDLNKIHESIDGVTDAINDND